MGYRASTPPRSPPGGATPSTSAPLREITLSHREAQTRPSSSGGERCLVRASKRRTSVLRGTHSRGVAVMLRAEWPLRTPRRRPVRGQAGARREGHLHLLRGRQGRWHVLPPLRAGNHLLLRSHQEARHVHQGLMAIPAPPAEEETSSGDAGRLAAGTRPGGQTRKRAPASRQGPDRFPCSTGWGAKRSADRLPASLLRG
jgi:hypothetical protein